MRAAPIVVALLGAACDAHDGERSSSPARASDSAASLLEQPLVEWPLGEAEARVVYPLPNAGYAFDALQGFKRRPNHEQRFVFAEHTGGGFVIRTNSLSLREDGEPSARRPSLRVLVAGDSHTDGACENAESFAHRLEALWRAEDPPRDVDVLNAGMGSSSFYNYLGMLERLASLEPHVFLVCVYGGNDWGETLAPWHHFHRTTRPAPGGDYDARLEAALALHDKWGRQAVSQSHNQFSYFQREPAQVEIAFRAALSVTAEIQRRANARGIELRIAYLPPCADVQRARLSPHIDELERVLGLDAAALAVTDALADRYLAWCRAAGIAALDLRPVLRAHGSEPLYWLQDLHVSVRGHVVIAEALREWFAREPVQAPPHALERVADPASEAPAPSARENGVK